MSDLTPPPDEPMPDQTRARIRADLLAAAQESPRARRWLVPAGVAAAVVVVAALAAWAVQAGPDDTTGGPAVAPSATPSATPSDVPEPTPDPTPESDTPAPPPEGQQAGAGDCEQEMEFVLAGAEQAAAFDDGTSFWVKGDRFVLCDVRGGVTTVHQPLPMSPVEKVDTYRVSSTNDVRVAGGVVTEDAMAFSVSYTFPDGVEVEAETVEGGGRTWWRAVHTYAAQGNELDDPPITVRVRYSGVEKSYELQWALDTCAQANHGC